MQYTIRNVPPALDQALRRKARELHKSLNQVTQEALAKGAGLGPDIQKYHDLDHFFGSWIEDSKVERALTEQRKIDKDLWA